MHVVATAGHVDHGKSTLVRALTGMEPDRWAEERRRGMTIDLGFAWTALPSGHTVAFVDVPGHHRFVGNMLAGVGPVPAVLFVVAADEGWSRQSAEHLAALDALGVEHGVLAVTRTDLADPAEAQAQARGHLSSTSLRDMPAVGVSAATGSGLAQLRAALQTMVASMPAPDTSTDRVRLWIDRSFSIRGAGTVVTGTLQAGAIRPGDTFSLASTGASVRVRAVQSLGQPCDEVRAVARVAVNLRAAPADIRRGDALLTPGGWQTAVAVDVRLTGRPAADLPSRLVLHVGAAAVPVLLRPLGPDTARLTLHRAVPLQNADRGVLRDPGEQHIAAGVTVLDAAPPTLSRRGAARDRAVVLATMTGADAAAEVQRRGVVRGELLAQLGCGVPVPTAGIRAVGAWYVAAATWAQWSAALERAVDAEHAARPLSAGLPVDAAVDIVGVPDRALLLAVAADADAIEASGGFLRRAGRQAELPAALGDLLAVLRDRPYTAPRAGELAAGGVTTAALAAAERAGLLLRLADEVVVTPATVEAAVATLAGLPQPFTLAQARDALQANRRVALAVLQHLDATGVTACDPAQRRTIRRSAG